MRLPDELGNLGMCCVCGEENDSVRNVLLLDTHAPIEGTGWGCVACGLPPDGALAVLCDECFESERPPRWVVYGSLTQKQRIAIEDAPSLPHAHNPERHAQLAHALEQLAQELETTESTDFSIN